MGDLGNILSAPEIRLCSICNQEFTVYYENSHVCGKCTRKTENQIKYKREKEKKEKKQKIDTIFLENSEDQDIDVLDEIELEPTRNCHDCGKPTSNYRCNDCWVKWKIKNNIPIYAKEDNLDDSWNE